MYALAEFLSDGKSEGASTLDSLDRDLDRLGTSCSSSSGTPRTLGYRGVKTFDSMKSLIVFAFLIVRLMTGLFLKTPPLKKCPIAQTTLRQRRMGTATLAKRKMIIGCILDLRYFL